jgi:Mlc titration factor MtfA (ptsG expression regulator)
MFKLKARRRQRLRSQPFPESWLQIVRRNVPYYDRLSASEQEELRSNIQVFMAEKNFEGCGGLEMTDEIKVTIAAYACILLLHRQHDFYPRLRTILVYPDAYPVKVVRPGPGNMVIEGHEMRAGESWHTGAVVISWNHVLHRPGDPQEGRNVVLHEFAHQLDQEDGSVNGAPLLPQTSMYRAWARILGREYQLLAEAADADRPTLLDKYGATNPAEFFAVVTEYFFEQPEQLQAQHPELYEELRLYYRQDPAAR